MLGGVKWHTSLRIARRNELWAAFRALGAGTPAFDNTDAC